MVVEQAPHSEPTRAQKSELQLPLSDLYILHFFKKIFSFYLEGKVRGGRQEEQR